MRTRSFVKLVAAVGSGAVLLAGCAGGGSGGSSGDAKVIKIGTLHPLSGANAGDGTQLENGVKLGIKAINDAGGIKALGGAKLELDGGDTKGTPDTGQSEAQRLVGDGVVALVGTYQSAVSANVAAVAERNKVPFVMDVSGDDAILSHGYKYSFRMQPQNSRFGTTAAQYVKAISAAANRPVTKVAYLHEATAFGTGVYQAFKAEAQKSGLQMGPEITYDAASVSDLTTQIAQVKASGANVLVVSGYYRDGVLAAKAIQTVKPALDAVVGAADGAFDQPQFPTDAGSASQGYFDVNYHFDDKSADAKAFSALYKTTYKDEARTGAALAYDSVRVIAAALEKAGSTDASKVRDAIAQTNLTPLTLSDGPIKFSDKGENSTSLPVLTQVQNGAPVVVYPQSAAVKSPVYPANPGQ
ncbi:MULTISPECIES: ABC transporter substrate-binding protein [unclassified Amycolatopsis]|uniref:ABC transporter substrate-binding protein n=1 Tax=unclassified Amycolatopsis TaxID=2618356 RepID=UPI001C6A2A57|nr:ABC transporter substrate-binding protein [Amycolatopsis sp. DSM 110486]QYN20676.1 ABC transporter substrate-binding protein [Amycolatopsis sp. DSM 110486]